MTAPARPSQGSLGDWARTPDRPSHVRTRGKPRRKNNITESQLDDVRELTEEMMATGDWGEAVPRHFVALYVILHESVYRASPPMSSQDRSSAASLAGRMLNADFGGDPGALAAYVRWVWQRERWREARRSADDTFRVTWRYQFRAGTGLLGDYRIAAARERLGARR